MKRAEYILIIGNSKVTEFMQHADLFDKGKVAGAVKEIILDFGDDVDLTVDHAEKAMWTVCDGIDKMQDYFCIFAHLVKIEDEYLVKKNNKLALPYINKNVREVSDGSKSFLLYEYIHGLGIEVDVTQNMYIR